MDAFAQVAGAPLGGGTGTIDMSVYGLFMQADWVVKAIMIREFATLQSLALQQTLWHMGRAVLEEIPSIVEVQLKAPNKHHFVVDLSPFGLDNPGEVFIAADRPYGLIEAQVLRDDAPPANDAWRFSAGLA